MIIKFNLQLFGTVNFCPFPVFILDFFSLIQKEKLAIRRNIHTYFFCSAKIATVQALQSF